MIPILAPAPTAGHTVLIAIDRAERIIAARAARHSTEQRDSTGDALRWALRVIVSELAHGDASPISDAEQYAARQQADQLVEQAAREHTSAAEVAR